jgi:cytochrome b6-f complex iron-sulfur subunit
MGDVRRRNRRQVDQQLQSIADGDRLPPGRLEDPDDLEAVRAAIALRAGRPAADLPSDDFLAVLQERLREEQEPLTARRGLSRRAVIAAGGVAAAVAAGVAVDRTLLSHNPAKGAPAVAADLAPNDGAWVPVSSVSDVGGGPPQRFTTASVVGFVTEHEGNLVAVSGACTHLGCLLQPNPPAGRLDCPCHRTSFGYDGRVLFSQLDTRPAPLPRIQARQHNGAVEVFVPGEA